MERIPMFAAALLGAWLIVTLFAKPGPDRWAHKILGFGPIALSFYLAIRNTYNLIAYKCMFFPDKIPGSKGMYLADFCPSPDTWLFYVAIPVPYVFHLLFFLFGMWFLRGWPKQPDKPSDASQDRRGAL